MEEVCLAFQRWSWGWVLVMLSPLYSGQFKEIIKPWRSWLTRKTDCKASYRMARLTNRLVVDRYWTSRAISSWFLLCFWVSSTMRFFSCFYRLRVPYRLLQASWTMPGTILHNFSACLNPMPWVSNILIQPHMPVNWHHFSYTIYIFSHNGMLLLGS